MVGSPAGSGNFCIAWWQNNDVAAYLGPWGMGNGTGSNLTISAYSSGTTQDIYISGDGSNFCAGANLNLILQASERKDFEALETLIGAMQQIFQSLRFAKFPVVAAPYGLVLGGGMEIIGACDRRVAAAESYIGLVEVGVGLIPGAGGNLRMLSNLS